ncbi:MAG: RNA polymerase sigma factor [Candidatus Kapabacteria bacterium]|nr:RNA polymerase sigma factor [Ignavibacteriota bacterium]MCW5884279.1 RNA polymerase sigma factor [Candidatus Kapabacteria bacterium]
MGQRFEEYSDTELFYMLCDDKHTAERAFSELFSRHSPRIYAYCKRFIGNTEEAQDIFQETFLRFHQSASKDREMTNLPAFLLRIARNLCVNFKKREKQAVSYEDYMAPDFGSENVSEKSELLDLIKDALEVLPDEYKEPFILREYNGMTYNEIAEITGQPLSNVKVRIYRAKQKIKEILEPYMQELD